MVQYSTAAKQEAIAQQIIDIITPADASENWDAAGEGVDAAQSWVCHRIAENPDDAWLYMLALRWVCRDLAKLAQDVATIQRRG